MPNIEKNVNIMSRCQIRVPYLFHNLTKRFPLPCIKCLALHGNVLLRRRNRKTAVTGSNPPKQKSYLVRILSEINIHHRV